MNLVSLAPNTIWGSDSDSEGVVGALIPSRFINFFTSLKTSCASSQSGLTPIFLPLMSVISLSVTCHSVDSAMLSLILPVLLVHRFHCIDVIYLPHHIPHHPCARRCERAGLYQYRLPSVRDRTPLHPMELTTIAFTARLLHIYQRYTLSFCNSSQSMAATRSRHEVYRRPSFLTDARRGRTASSFLTTRRGRTASERLDVIK